MGFRALWVSLAVRKLGSFPVGLKILAEEWTSVGLSIFERECFEAFRVG